MRQILRGMGCFWGAERKLWEAPGAHATRNAVRKNSALDSKKMLRP